MLNRTIIVKIIKTITRIIIIGLFINKDHMRKIKSRIKIKNRMKIKIL